MSVRQTTEGASMSVGTLLAAIRVGATTDLLCTITDMIARKVVASTS